MYYNVDVVFVALITFFYFHDHRDAKFIYNFFLLKLDFQTFYHKIKFSKYIN